jgi:hypothetical protein
VRGLLSALASVLIFVLVRPGLAQNQDTTAALVLACDRAAASLRLISRISNQIKGESSCAPNYFATTKGRLA